MPTIKPPASGPTRTITDLVDARASVEAPDKPDATTSVGAAGDFVTQLAQRVDEGAMTLDEAVERLVQQTVARAKHQLTAAQRTELGDVLRQAMATDPTLAALRDGSR